MSKPNNTAMVDSTEDAALARWNALLEAITAGAPLEAACLSARITSTEITAFTLSPVEAQRWVKACLAAKRHRWPQLELDEIFARIARGLKVEQVLVEVRGSSEDAGEFFELLDTPDLAERYAAAQRAAARAMVGNLVDIASDDSRDILDNGKGGQQANMAAVSRSKLRVEHGQWLLAAHLPETYGQQKGNVNVQVNVNPAEILEEARERARLRGKPKVTPQQFQNAIDATFAETPVPTLAEKNHRALVAGAATADRIMAETEPEPAVEHAEGKDLSGLDD